MDVYHLQHSRSESFDDANLSHETQLLELWTLLQPDRPLLKRVTKQWQDIGEILISLVSNTDLARAQVSKARIPKLISEGWEFLVCKTSCKNRYDIDDGQYHHHYRNNFTLDILPSSLGRRPSTFFRIHIIPNSGKNEHHHEHDIMIMKSVVLW